jgi:hypothetical protein
MEDFMPSKYLLPESVAQQDGSGAVIALETSRGKPVLLTLGITRIVEQESLEVCVWGSSDKQRWRPLQTFARKSYCATYSVLLDLSRDPDVRYLRAEWKMYRWGRSDAPLFAFYLSVEECLLQTVGAA